MLILSIWIEMYDGYFFGGLSINDSAVESAEQDHM